MSDTPNVILEFIGGSEDGAVLRSPLANPYYWATDEARLGAVFNVFPTHTFLTKSLGAISGSERLIYRIVERRQEWDHVFVRAEFVGRGMIEQSIPSPSD